MIPFLTEAINRYCDAHTSDEADYLMELERQTHLKALMPQMLSGKLQGRLLSLLSRLQKPKYILEIGTFTGYSALCLAEGLRTDGELHTIDNSDQYDSLINDFAKKSNYARQILFHRGDALELIPKLDKSWDLIFVDAAKDEYLEYLFLLESKLLPGTMLITDNVLWYGKVLEEVKDKETQILHDYSEYLKTSASWEVIMLPIRDGISVAIKQ